MMFTEHQAPVLAAALRCFAHCSRHRLFFVAAVLFTEVFLFQEFPIRIGDFVNLETGNTEGKHKGESLVDYLIQQESFLSCTRNQKYRVVLRNWGLWKERSFQLFANSLEVPSARRTNLNTRKSNLKSVEKHATARFFPFSNEFRSSPVGPQNL